MFLQEFNWIASIQIGLALVITAFFISLFYLPKSTRKRDQPDDPDITLTHLKYLYIECYTMIIGGLLLMTVGILLPLF